MFIFHSYKGAWLKNSRFILRVLLLAPVVIVPAIVLVVATLIIDVEEESFHNSIAQIESDFIENEKHFI